MISASKLYGMSQLMKTCPLIRRWRRVPLDTPPFLFPGDEEILQETKTCVHESFDGWIASAEFGDRKDNSLHLGLIPSPYWGDIRRASVYLLMLNPGLSNADYFAENRDPEIRKRLIQTLRQDLSAKSNPSCFLDPHFSWHPGSRYWLSKLDDVLWAFVEQMDVSFQEALKSVAEKVACLQLVPYHSRKFGLSGRCLAHLPSSIAIREFVHSELVPFAREGKKTLIVVRGSKHWGLKDGKGIVVYKQSEPRGAHLNLRSSGGRVIAETLGLTVRT
jgi:hypothetical protein